MMLEESCGAIKIISRGGIMRCCRRSTTTRFHEIGTYRGEREVQGRERNEKKRITTKKARL